MNGRRRRATLYACGLLHVTAAACGSGAQTSSLGALDGGPTETDAAPAEDTQLPSRATPEAVDAFLDAEGYKADRWRAETVEPRPETTSVSPHDDVRVFQNDTLIQSRSDAGFAPGSMAVKELYQDGDLVGYAAMWKVTQEESFTYFCWGPTGRCGSQERETPRDQPVFGRGLDVVCGACHGDMVFTHIEP